MMDQGNLSWGARTTKTRRGGGEGRVQTLLNAEPCPQGLRVGRGLKAVDREGCLTQQFQGWKAVPGGDMVLGSHHGVAEMETRRVGHWNDGVTRSGSHRLKGD